MKIVHLSDFHLNPHNLEDWNDYIKEALITLIKDNSTNDDNLFVLCTGDLIDKGGKNYKGVTNALKVFKEKVIDYIVEQTGITQDRFVITPGNHDIDREADDEIVNNGLRTSFSTEGKGVDNLISYAKSVLDKSEHKYTQRIIEYKTFEKALYENYDNVKVTLLGSSFKYQCDGRKVCINAINTSWLAYDNDDKKYGLAVSEPQYNMLKAELKDADVKIAIMHHPVDWLKYEERTVAGWLFKDYDLMTVGHVHESDSTITSKLAGTMFINVAPCFTNNIRSESKSFANGLTLIDYNPVTRRIICNYYVYNLSQRKYVLNTDFAESGCWNKVIPSDRDNSIDGTIEHAIDYIKTVHYPEMEEDLIPQKAKAIKGLRDAYIHMPISLHGDENRNNIELNGIVNNTQNQIFFGTSDSGKTVLLYRLLMEYVEAFHVHNLIPVYVDFNDVGNRDFLAIIRDYIDCDSNEAKELLKAKKVILLVDNYGVAEESKYQRLRLYKFQKDYYVQIISTAASTLPRVLPSSFIDKNNIAFEYYHIEPFKAENIKQLMTKWSPDDEFIDRNNKLEKMVSSFCSYSLPCSAMSVSLYLWSTENANREPVNQAVLLDIYIEIILEKLSKENVYHNTFDYKNKTMLLAYLAKYMHDEGKLSISKGKYTDKVSEYLNTVGFKTFDPDKLAQYFLDRKIFVKKDNNISFAHSCFYYFFLARRMEDDKAFYSQVVNENSFYKYDRVIDCYTGLVRRDDYLLNLLFTEFKKYFEPATPLYNGVDVDMFFTNVVREEKDFVPIVEHIDVKHVVQNKPTQEVVEQHMEEVADTRLSRITDEVTNITYLTPDQFIVIMSRVLRNLDGIEDVELKTKIYSEIVKNTIIFIVSLKNKLAIYANNNKGQLPPCYSNIKNVEFFFRFMPYAVQSSLYEFMGTTKLCQVFENKLKSDFTSDCSDVEKFISLGLLWDTNNLANTKLMKKFIKSVGKNSSRDYVTIKLYMNYMYKVVSGSKEEDQYLELLGKLKSRQYTLPFLKQRLLVADLKEEKKRRDSKRD